MPDTSIAEQPVIRTPEVTALKPAEVKPIEKPLGAPEQAIIQTIKQDSDPDNTLRDIAGLNNTEDSQGSETEKPMRASDVIFNGVYDQIRQGTWGRTAEEKGKHFIEGVALKADMHLSEIQSGNLTNQQVFAEVWAKMDAYIGRYAGTSRFEGKKQGAIDVFNKLRANANSLVASGDVDPLTAKAFVRYLDRYKHIGEHHYNAIVRSNQEVSDEVFKKNGVDYAASLGKIVEDRGDQAKEQESGGFIHFNSNQEGAITNRIYINPDLSQSPAKVLETFDAALAQTGLSDKVYFKVPNGLQKRQEGIVVYVTDKTDPADVQNLLQTFSGTCPPDLLSQNIMPSAVSIERGISIAPEPAGINDFLKFAGTDENISHNEWASSSVELAFELAYNEAAKRGDQNITPKSLKDSAGRYFNQITRLSGLNPDTMMPVASGGHLPKWAGPST